MKLIQLSSMFAGLFLFAAAGCSDDGDGGECTEGTDGCACTVDLACNAGLVCTASICSAPGASVGGAAATSGGAPATSGGAPATSGGATSGGAPATSGGATSGGAPATSGGATSGGMAGDGDGDTGGMAGDGDGDTGGMAGDGDGDGDVFTLTSEELTEGEPYPDAHTCAGGGGELNFGMPPSLAWSGFPAETMSFALTMIDVTLVDGDANYLGCHSGFWNLPVSETSLPVDDWSGAITGMDNIRGGYLGPCPGGNLDTYEITLYAFAEETIPNPGNMGDIDSCNALRKTLDDSSIAKVVLSGTSDAM